MARAATSSLRLQALGGRSSLDAVSSPRPSTRTSHVEFRALGSPLVRIDFSVIGLSPTEHEEALTNPTFALRAVGAVGAEGRCRDPFTDAPRTGSSSGEPASGAAAT